ncbi:hypothetical protein V495_04343 [Pseudogymnoascus sp. VKM F-4514 (FW-929)]|nr:hypothetical protein V495_04343 [Pseudogymnoascus sp. VKM F-4514 (FW-929)]KFY56143.1 hypothetical protein V497_06484 [Pseudogymnoascus sp. VKM F-4516 (FW-969)]
MPSQNKQNTGNPTGNTSSNAGPSMGCGIRGVSVGHVIYRPGGQLLSRADLDAAASGPAYDPLAVWAASMSRDDNPFSDCRFELDAMEMEKLAAKKPAPKKSTEKKITHGKQKSK